MYELKALMEGKALSWLFSLLPKSLGFDVVPAVCTSGAAIVDVQLISCYDGC